MGISVVRMEEKDRLKPIYDLPDSPGLYKLTLAGKVYIGSTNNLRRRGIEHHALLLFGAVLEVVKLISMETTKRERISEEDQLILELRKQGVEVVNNTNYENHQTRGRNACSKRSKEFFVKFNRAANNAKTPESRSASNKKAWVTRRAQMGVVVNG